MNQMLSLLVALFSITNLIAQPEAYNVHITKAEELYHNADYAASAVEYSAAFETFGWKGYIPDRYMAARAWSMAGVPDSAFFQLFRIAERANYQNLEELTKEAAFDSMHAHPRWEELCALVKANQPTMPALAKELEKIHEEDQKYRQMIDSVQAKFGAKSAEMQGLWDIMSTTDSINTLRVKQILDTYGWLGDKAIGSRGNSALFLVIQHADIEIQEKYLPMMQEAVKNGNAEGSSLALLEDRILMRNGKKQIYGSQLRSDPVTGEMYFFPIEDVDHVDEKRASVGLGPIAEYSGYFGIVWDATVIEKNRNMVPDNAKERKKN